jgi:hypothetical protein
MTRTLLVLLLSFAFSANAFAQATGAWTVVAGGGQTRGGTYNVHGVFAARVDRDPVTMTRVPLVVSLGVASPGALSGDCVSSSGYCFRHFPTTVALSAGPTHALRRFGLVGVRGMLGLAAVAYHESDPPRVGVGRRTGIAPGADAGLQIGIGSDPRGTGFVIAWHPTVMAGPDRRAMWLLPVLAGWRF